MKTKTTHTIVIKPCEITTYESRLGRKNLLMEIAEKRGLPAIFNSETDDLKPDFTRISELEAIRQAGHVVIWWTERNPFDYEDLFGVV